MNAHRRTTILIRLLILLLTLSGLSASLGAAHASPNLVSDFFVTPSGSGSACTQASPCDLATAVSLAGEGATIYVAAGTYTGTGAEVVKVENSVNLLGGWMAPPAERCCATRRCTSACWMAGCPPGDFR